MNKRLEHIIRQQDWHYPEAAVNWQDGLFLGNGNIGATAYAPSHLEWVFNKHDVFDPTVEEAMSEKILPHKKVMELLEKQEHKNSFFLRELESAPMQRGAIRNTISAARLRLRFWHGIGWAAPPVPQTSQTLSLWDGVLTETMSSHNFHPSVEMFAARNSGVFCMRISEISAPQRSHIFEFVRPASELLDAPEWREIDGVAGFVQKLPGCRHSYAAVIKIVPRDGGTPGNVRHLRGTYSETVQYGNCDIFIAFKSSFEARDPFAAAAQEAEAFAALGYDEAKKIHTAWWHRYWDSGYIDFGKNKLFQKYFTFSLYSLACNYSKAPMPGLNALAYAPDNEQTPGLMFQAYTHDQNVQIPAMPFFPLNRTELVKVIADTYLSNRTTLRKHTRRLFNCGGIFLPLQMNQLGREYPVRHYRYTICGSAYTGLILSMAWKYSRDVKLLKTRLYPLLKDFADFYLSLMSKDPDGTYHLDWSVPPEIFTFTRDEAAAISMLKVILSTLVETSQILKRDKLRRQLWQDVLDHYPAIPLTPDGALWAGRDIPFDHYFFGGHILYAYFPAGITDDKEIARKTLELIARESVERSFADITDTSHPNHEWSMFLQTAATLFMGDRIAGWQGIGRFLELFGKENGLFSHDPIIIGAPETSEANEQKNLHRLQTGRRWVDGSILQLDNPDTSHAVTVTPNKRAKRLAPPVLEGSSAFLYLCSAAFLQSRNGWIKLFPGVPEKFSGSFDRLLAEGALEVSAKMRDGEVLQIKLHSLYGGKYCILDPFCNGGKDLDIELKPGEKILLKNPCRK